MSRRRLRWEQIGDWIAFALLMAVCIWASAHL